MTEIIIRDRIKELRRVPASQLIPHPKNWKVHPERQREAIRGLLSEIGFAGAALTFETKNGLMLIDGHDRSEECGDSPIPVLVTDLTAKEAEKLLATYDPVGAMAETDSGKLDGLLKSVAKGNSALKAMLANLAASAPIDLSDPPESVEQNAAQLETIEQQRKRGNEGIVGKTGFVIVYPSRAAKDEALARLGLPSGERYVPAAAVELRARGTAGKLTPAKATNRRRMKSVDRKKSKSQH